MAEHIVNADDISRCIKSVSESSVKQWTLGVDIFSNDPIKLLPQAETLEKYLEKINPHEPKFACVYIGRDTRISSPGLAQAVINGIKALDVNY